MERGRERKIERREREIDRKIERREKDEGERHRKWQEGRRQGQIEVDR